MATTAAARSRALLGAFHRWSRLSYHHAVRGGTRSYRSTSSSWSSSPHESHLLHIHPPVRDALRQNRPVVALESTLLAHGLPYPQNLQLAQTLSALLRAQGVEPATIALHQGRIQIGLTPAQLVELCETDNAQKCSTREMSLLLAQQQLDSESSPQWGATTVASTMRAAALAGIDTFCTGGIGGVHWGGQDTLDVSADLVELSRTPVIVVSAGIKSILDINRTLQVLETQGVPVVAWQTDAMPAFFSASVDGIPAPARVDSAVEVATAFAIARDLQLPHGMLVAVPNPEPAVDIETAIQAALLESQELGLTGQAVTPFLLKRVAETTANASLKANVALVQHNCRIGAQIAVARAAQKQPRRQQSSPRLFSSSSLSSLSKSEPTRENDRKIVILGGVVLDVVAQPTETQLQRKTSNPAVCRESDGGVGRNLAEVLLRLNGAAAAAKESLLTIHLYSAVGKDARGAALLDRLVSLSSSNDNACQVDCTGVLRLDGGRTATYVALLDEDGDLDTACADMTILHDILPVPVEALQDARMLVVDANPPITVLVETVKRAVAAAVPVFWEPTSVSKTRQLADRDEFLACLTYASPNEDELFAMDNDDDDDDESHGVTVCNDDYLYYGDYYDSDDDDDDALPCKDGFFAGLRYAPPDEDELLFAMDDSDDDESQGATVRNDDNDDWEGRIQKVAERVLYRMHPAEAHLIVTLAERGVLLASKTQGKFHTKHFSALPATLVNATGAGDTLAGAVIHALLRGSSLAEAVAFGQAAAVQSLECADCAISPFLGSPDSMTKTL